MRASEFLTEYRRLKKYRDGGKPDWYEKAVKLKTDNPRMSAVEIGRQVGAVSNTIHFWLTGRPDSKGNIYNDNPPFTQKDFPLGVGRIYFDGAKPWWYEEAIKLRKQGMIFPAISNKLSTPEKKIGPVSIARWLVKGKKYPSGKLINPDAPFTPKPKAKPINIDLIKELIVDKYTDEEIIELIADEKGNKIANQIKAIIPKLRQKLNPGTSVIDKTRTGVMKDPDITGFVQEKYTGDNWQLLEVDDQFQAPVGDCFEAAYKKLYKVFREHPEAKLVHAIVTGQGPIKGVQHGHAWVEIGDTVLDYSNGRSIEMPKQIYYAIGNVDPSNSDEYKIYSFKDMVDISMDQGTYGPWELPKGSL